MDASLNLPIHKFNEIQTTLQSGKFKPLLCQCGEEVVCWCTKEDDHETPELDECGCCGRYVPWCYFPDINNSLCGHCTLVGRSLTAVMEAIV